MLVFCFWGFFTTISSIPAKSLLDMFFCWTWNFDFLSLDTLGCRTMLIELLSFRHLTAFIFWGCWNGLFRLISLLKFFCFFDPNGAGETKLRIASMLGLVRGDPIILFEILILRVWVRIGLFSLFLLFILTLNVPLLPPLCFGSTDMLFLFCEGFLRGRGWETFRHFLFMKEYTSLNPLFGQ